MEKKKVLIFGGTGYLGKYMVKASVASGHTTYAYTRSVTSTDLSKNQTLEEFKSIGVTLVQGELDDDEKLALALEQVDIVISTLAVPQHLDQLKIISVMKQLQGGNIERFVPSEYGNDVDRVEDALPPFQELLDMKKQIRRAIEEARIPYTYVAANSLAAYFVDYMFHPHDRHQESPEVTVYGTGETKTVWNYEGDVAGYTIQASSDPRTLNKVIILRPPGNIASQLDVISSWERKTNQTLSKTYIPGEVLIHLSQTLPHPDNIPVAILHNIFVKGDQMNFDLTEEDLEASALYPHYNYTPIDSFLDRCLVDPPKVTLSSFT